MTQEIEIWSGNPSQINNLGTYIICGLLALTVTGIVVAIPLAIWRYLVVKN